MSIVEKIASWAAGAGTAGLIEMFGGIKQALINEPTEAMVRAFKMSLAKYFGFDNIFIGAFDSVNDARPSFTCGISPDGIIDIFNAMINASIALSALIGDEMAEELLLELLQEGASNAIQYSIGGAFQTIYNVYRGGMTLYSDDMTQIPQMIGILDDKINIFNLASAGGNILSTLFYSVFGAVDNTERTYMDALQQLQTQLSRLIDENLWVHLTYLEYARQWLLYVIRTNATYASFMANYGTSGLEVAISRINDKINELETVYKDLQADIITPEHAEEVRQAIYKEYETLKQHVDDLVQEVENEILAITFEIPDEVKEEYQNALERLKLEVEKMIDVTNQKFTEELTQLFEKILDYIDGVLAYRYYLDYGQYPENAPEIYKWFSLEKPQYVKLRIKVVGEAT